jgi:threonine synthase
VPVQYVSTRGAASALPFADVLLAGLASDGGLYVPAEVPSLPARWAEAPDRGYTATATEVMWPFVEASIARDAWASLVADAYAGFGHPDVVPVRKLAPNLYLAELFWGPTLAFKDVALQLVGRLFDAELQRRNERVTVVGATSGDTGSAAIQALRDRDAVDCVILHPHGRVSEVQRRQMTTVDAPNIWNLAVEGTFDDCQDLVKAMFADEPFRNRLRLSAVNSINWARVMAQVVYYVTSAASVGAGNAGAGRGQPVTFVVPTGNFGNVYAGHIARRMGLPIGRLVVASNRNDILTRLFTTGTMAMETVVPTHSPSMDIQVSSNLERLLWEAVGRDGKLVTTLLKRFRDERALSLEPAVFKLLGDGFAAHRTDDQATLDVIRRVYEQHGVLVDPHTAVGLAGVFDQPCTEPTVVLATAHPAKFPDAVERATGVRPALPDRLADLLERPERVTVVPNDLARVEAFVAEHARLLAR